MEDEDSEPTPEDKLIENLLKGLRDVVLKSSVEYGKEKLKQKYPELKEKFQDWMKKYFSKP